MNLTWSALCMAAALLTSAGRLTAASEPPLPPIAPTDEDCQRYLAERLRIGRELVAEWQACCGAQIKKGVKIGYAADRTGRLQLVAIPECKPLANKIDAFADETNRLSQQCFKEAREKKFADEKKKAEAEKRLERARKAVDAAEKLRDLRDLFDDPYEFFLRALEDEAKVRNLLRPKDDNFEEANNLYALAIKFSRWGIEKQQNPIIREIQSEQLERVIRFQSALMSQWKEAEQQIETFTVQMIGPPPPYRPPPSPAAPEFDCSILRDPVKNRALLESDPILWQQLVDKCAGESTR